MKKIFVSVLCALLLVGCAAPKANETHGNYTDEMKIAKAVDLEEYGADSVERMGDHQDSPYFSRLDFYNMKSTDSLTIIENFKTYQQTSEWSCGVAASLMVMDYYGMLGDYNEETLAQFRTNGLDYAGTTLESILKIFEGVGGFKVESTYDYDPETLWEEITLDTVRGYLEEGVPVIVGWNDWGGHWQVIIGYDDMGTKDYTGDDVLIMADSYDTTDHNQDGYTVYGAERFYYNWTMFDFFESYGVEERDLLFAAARPAK